MNEQTMERFKKACGLIKGGSLDAAIRELESIDAEEALHGRECLNVKRWLGIAYMSVGEKETFRKAEKEFLYIVNSIINNKNAFLLDLDWEKKESAKSLLALTYHDLAVIYIYISHFLDAERCLLEAVKLVREEARASTLAWFLNDLGWLYYKRGRFQEAIEQYEKVLDIEFSDDEMHLRGYPYFYRALAKFQLGDLLAASNDLNQAQDIFERKVQSIKEKSSELDSIRAAILTNMGRIEIVQCKFRIAEDTLKKAGALYDRLEQDYIGNITPVMRRRELENISALHNNLGILYYKQNNLTEAEKEFHKALKYFPDSGRANNNLGAVYAKSGDREEAIGHYLKALSISPGMEAAENNLKLLKEAADKRSNWWEWWFDKGSYPKKATGCVLIVMLGILLAGMVLPSAMELSFSGATAVQLISGESPGIIQVPTENSTVVEVSNKTVLERSATLAALKSGNISSGGSGKSGIPAPSGNGTTTTTTTTKTTKKSSGTSSQMSMESRLLAAAFVLFILIHPQIKGFGAGVVKFDMEPSTETKGAGTEPNCI